MDQNLQKIKQTIIEISKEMNIEIEKIILFGSRARGDYREDSDYDILIITKEKLDKEKYYEFHHKIVKELSKNNVFGDFIIVSKEYMEINQSNVGSVCYYALEEGIEL